MSYFDFLFKGAHYRKLIDFPESRFDHCRRVTFSVSRGGQILGEYSREDFIIGVSSGAFLPSDFFWTEGMAEWQPVSSYRSVKPEPAPKATPGPSLASVMANKPLRAAPRSGNIGDVLRQPMVWVPALFIFFLILAVKSSQPSKNSKGVANISVGASALILRVTNNGTADWHEMAVYLNGMPPFAFKWEGAAPEVGQAVSISLNEFATKDGERFDPLHRKVKEAWVGGGGYDYARVSF